MTYEENVVSCRGRARELSEREKPDPVAAEALRRMAGRDDLDPCLAFPEGSCCFTFGDEKRPLPIGSLRLGGGLAVDAAVPRVRGDAARGRLRWAAQQGRNGLRVRRLRPVVVPADRRVGDDGRPREEVADRGDEVPAGGRHVWRGRLVGWQGATRGAQDGPARALCGPVGSHLVRGSAAESGHWGRVS